MALMDKKQLRELIKENDIKTAGDIQNVLREQFKDTLQECWKPNSMTAWGMRKISENK